MIGTEINEFIDMRALVRIGPVRFAMLTTVNLLTLLGKAQLEIAISELNKFILPSYENIVALILGAACATEMCKPSVAWALISSAAELCQNLGYHRYWTIKDDNENERNSKILVFWTVYMFDKRLSLRLGRASTIQDWDVSLPFPALGSAPAPDFPGTNALSYWVKVARIQGQAYEKLFSPSAFRRTTEERARTAVNLVLAMDRALHEREKSEHKSSSRLSDRKSTSFVEPARISLRETNAPSQRIHIGQQLSRPALEPDSHIESKTIYPTMDT